MTAEAEIPFYKQSFRKRYKRILKLYDILKKQESQIPLITLVKEMHDIAVRTTDSEKKLREIVDMLPDIKDRLSILNKQKLDDGYYFGGDTPEEILKKIGKWESE